MGRLPLRPHITTGFTHLWGAAHQGPLIAQPTAVWENVLTVRDPWLEHGYNAALNARSGSA
jgi:hypothetical protein